MSEPQETLAAQADLEPEGESIDLNEAIRPHVDELPQDDEERVVYGDQSFSPDEFMERTKHTVNVLGEDVDVDYKELVKGYQRGADYERKSAEVKKQHEDIWPYAQMVAYAKTDPGFVEHIQSYFRSNPRAVSDPELMIPDGELAQLMQYDPERANRILAKRDQWSRESQARKDAEQRAQWEYTNIMAQAREHAERAAEREVDKTFGKGTWKQRPQVVEYLREQGLTDAELSAFMSPAACKLAFEAYRNRTVKGTKAGIGKKRRKLSPPRAMPSGGQSKPRKSGQKAFQKAVNTQTTDAWTDYIAGRLS